MLLTDHAIRPTLKDLIGLQYTYAFSSKAVLDGQREEHEHELRAGPAAAEPAEQFAATVKAQFIIDARPGAGRC